MHLKHNIVRHCERPAGAKQSRIRGYTLIELSIVVAILGIILGTGLAFYNRYLEANKHEVTDERLAEIEQALYDFYIINGHFPCPADGSLAPGNANYGIDHETAGGDYANGECDDDSSDLPNHTGTVPTRTLNLPDEYMLDGWGRRFTYRIATGMGSQADFESDAPVYPGNLTIQNLDGNQLTANAVYVVISHGVNGSYSWLLSGAASGFTGDANEVENAPTNANDTYVYGPSTQAYDDVVAFKVKSNFYYEPKPIAPIRFPTAATADICSWADTIASTYTAADWSGGAGGGTIAMQAAQTIDDLCDNGIPSPEKNCPNNLVWSDLNNGCECGAGTYNTSFTTEVFGGCN